MSTTDYLLGRTEVKQPMKSVQSAGRLNRLPLLGTIRAGLPLLAKENWLGEVEVPSDLKADFALRVIGDSMSWVGIHEGDIAILRQIDIPSHGMIVAAGIEENEWTATLKFYVQENGYPVLRAANPNYEDIKVDSNHRIIGQLVSVQKEPPILQDYKNMLISKEIMDKQWNEAVETATKYGLDREQIANMIELFADMAKKMKSSKKQI